jgi:hypothetical protein
LVSADLDTFVANHQSNIPVLRATQPAGEFGIMQLDNQIQLDPAARRFYRETISILLGNNVPFLVGGAHAFCRYTGVIRDTKDFDIFIRRADYGRTLAALGAAGYKTEVTDEVWIVKAFYERFYVDVIFGSANGIAGVDEQWFEFSVPSEVFDMPVLLVPPEEMIWQKAYIMERDRFDGADVAHLFHTCFDKLDWQRLLMRFGSAWRVLYAQLILFGFVYPSKRDCVPQWLMEELGRRLILETGSAAPQSNVCFGPVLAATQYLVDINTWGYADGRPKRD